VQADTVKNQVWAWMTANGLSYRKIDVRGEIIESGFKQPDAYNLIASFIPIAVDKIVTAHDWDFVCDVATTTTVSGTSEYTLSGNNDDCRDIINLRIGAGRGRVLERLNTLQTDRRESEDEDVGDETDTSDVYGYTQYGRSADGKPMVQLFDTPSEAKTLKYRYRMSGITIDHLPDEFGYVVRDMVIAQFKTEYLGIAKVGLNEMIARYNVGGDHYETVRIDPVIEAGNNRRSNDLPGGC